MAIRNQILKRKNKYLKIFIFLFLSLAFVRKKQDETYKEREIIVWDKSNKLKWDYFKGKYHGSNKNAGTYSLIYSLYTNNTLKSINIRACFVLKASWKTDKNLSDYLLNHEQKHFDITEIYARKLRKMLIDTFFKTETISRMEIPKIIRSNNKALNNYQDLYDQETNHSRNKENQSLWDKKIDDELNSLNSFTNNLIEIRIK